MAIINYLKSVILNWVGIASSRIVFFAFVLVAGVIIIKLITAIVNKALQKSKLEKAAHSLIRSLLRGVLYLLLGLIAASTLGIDVSGVIALASVLTLAVSLSVQNLLSNVIGGFTLLYTKPFRSGDFVEIAGRTGTVQEIGMTYTKLVTPDNKIVDIPNSSVVATDIVNYSVTGTRRVDLKVSASYDAPTEAVLEALYEAAKVDGVLADPAPFAAVESYGEHAVNYILRVWCTTEQYWDVNFAVNAKVRQAFADKGVSMTYPHLNVHIDK